jgi:Do/DeqQ family serine protease
MSGDMTALEEKTLMDNARIPLSRRAARAGIAVGAAVLLIAGATWHGFAADSTSNAAGSQTVAAQTAPPISRAAIGGRDSYADIVKVVAPAVVTVRTEGRAHVAPTDFDGGGDDQDQNQEFFRRFFGPQFDQGQNGHRAPRSFKQRALGSGVVITNDGYILTNDHVIDDADDVQIEFTDGKTYKAKVVGADKPSDLALLKIEATSLPTVAIGNSDAVQVGDVVLALGNPLGIGQTVTMGIISAKGRSTATGEDRGYEDFLQTDAPINHGNSGGALVNLKGELVGINSQILSPSDGNIGIGFAIPSNMAHHVMDDLRKDGRVRRAQLGVTVQPVTSDMADSLGLKDVGGAIVSSVGTDSAAARAGLKRGDVIKSFNGQPVHDFNSLRNRVAEMTPGAGATVGIIRDGSEKTLTVKLDEAEVSKSARNTEDSANDDKASLGVAVSPLTPELAARAGLPRDTHGMLVQQVNPDGRAADAGIQAGDVIVEVNRQSVQTIDELRSAMQKAATDRPTLLLVSREGKDLFVTVRPS